MLRIKDIREQRDLTQAQVADKLGIHLTNYNKLENGKSEVTLARLDQIAKILNVAAADLISNHGNVRTVRVRQHVQAGTWAESFLWEEDDCYDVIVPDDADYRDFTLYGAETLGPSMNRRYPERSALIYTSIIETGEKPEPGKRYIIERERPDGMREATVKTLFQDDTGKLWLIPESTDPRHQTPIDLSQDDGDIVRIVGRVIFSVQRED